MAREYPPALLIHRPGCADLGLVEIGDKSIQPLLKIAKQHPNARPHSCLDQGTKTTLAIAKEADWPEHQYRPSTIKVFEPWDDGTTPEPPASPLCEVCRGTRGVHVNAGPRERIEVRG